MQYRHGYSKPVPRDPERALLLGLPVPNNQHFSAWRTANMLGPDIHRKAGRRTGYPIHLHCWLLLGRVIPLETVKQNLRVFVQSSKDFWRDNVKDWMYSPIHKSGTIDCFEQGVFGSRGPRVKGGRSVRDRKPHFPGSPLRNPAIRGLIQSAIMPEKSGNGYSPRCSASSPLLPRLPLEIAMEIVDVVSSVPLSMDRITDTRNILEAFRWPIPSSYWIRRCEPSLVLEVDELAKSGKPVDWAGLCLGLEQLMVDRHWFCKSGLHYRRRVLRLLGGIKERFDGIMSGPVVQN